jgi:hypothetical protein
MMEQEERVDAEDAESDCPLAKNFDFIPVFQTINFENESAYWSVLEDYCCDTGGGLWF